MLDMDWRVAGSKWWLTAGEVIHPICWTDPPPLIWIHLEGLVWLRFFKRLGEKGRSHKQFEVQLVSEVQKLKSFGRCCKKMQGTNVFSLNGFAISKDLLKKRFDPWIIVCHPFSSSLVAFHLFRVWKKTRLFLDVILLRNTWCRPMEMPREWIRVAIPAAWVLVARTLTAGSVGSTSSCIHGRSLLAETKILDAGDFFQFWGVETCSRALTYQSNFFETTSKTLLVRIHTNWRGSSPGNLHFS